MRSVHVQSHVLQVNSASRWCAEGDIVPFPPVPTAPTASPSEAPTPLWPTVNSRAPPSTALWIPVTFLHVRMMRSAKTKTTTRIGNGMRRVRSAVTVVITLLLVAVPLTSTSGGKRRDPVLNTALRSWKMEVYLDAALGDMRGRFKEDSQ